MSFLALFSLSACQAQPRLPLSSEPPLPPSPNLQQVLSNDHLLVFLQKDGLYLVDPQFPQPVLITQLSINQIPLSPNLYTFQLDPEKQYVVWYSPQAGLLKLSLQDKKISVIHPASDWLNQHPYFEFTSSPSRVHFVAAQGLQLFSVELSSGKTSTTPIPYPFGNLFRISPDHLSIAYVSGFNPSSPSPQLMFTDLNGQNPQVTTLNIQATKKSLLDWHPDSTGIITLQNDHQIVLIPRTHPTSPEIIYQTEPTDPIKSLSIFDRQLHFATQNTWYVLDPSTRKLVARTPLSIASEINHPQFFPWYDHQLLIQETIKQQDQQFSRLWLSNFMGVKKLTIDRFHQITIKSDTPTL